MICAVYQSSIIYNQSNPCHPQELSARLLKEGQNRGIDPHEVTSTKIKNKKWHTRVGTKYLFMGCLPQSLKFLDLVILLNPTHHHFPSPYKCL